ncbi:MAG: zinc ribbon domain-containing protein [Candidatus Thorarchaeota archaeon]
MRRGEQLVIAGFITVFIGLVILAFSSVSPGEGFFFVFPFFFFAGSNAAIGLLLVGAIFVLIFYFIRTLQVSTTTEAQWNTRQDRPSYVRLTKVCDFCGEPVPEGASFCPSCGSPAQRESTSDYYSQ